MPLAFDSRSHGRVAFGFFNIDCDMLLLERDFFFADRFCAAIAAGAAADDDRPVALGWEAHRILDPADVGDLMGAIHGLRFTGFIGDTYRRFPFPAREEDFKQHPDGAVNRAVFVELIEQYAERVALPLVADRGADEVTIGEIRFARRVFHELVHYVWRGGYPRWRDEVRPEYVLDLRRAIEQSPHWLFAGFRF